MPATLEKRLDRLGLFRMDLTLDRMRSFLAETGLTRPAPSVVQVVGTNGKGSTAAFVERMAREHGLSTGLFTSPHFVGFRERLLTNGRLPSDEVLLPTAEAVLETGVGEDLTYFEFLTCLAAWMFAEARVDVAVFEAGLGGTWDATTALTRDLVLVTPIGLDHQDRLGATIEAIARDKAGSFPVQGTVVCAPQQASVRDVLEKAARERSARLFMAGELASRLPGPVGMAGAHQLGNARLALAGFGFVARGLGLEVDENALATALRETFVPGRLQRVPGDPEFILDGAHNVPGLVALDAALADLDIHPTAMVFACMRDKDVAGMVEAASALTDGLVHLPDIGVERAVDPAELAGLFGERARLHSAPGEMLDELADGPGPVLVCGSLYLLAELFRLRPHWLDDRAGR
jgi:dihydrofolate synthase/folylpolyglutamate synthase